MNNIYLILVSLLVLLINTEVSNSWMINVQEKVIIEVYQRSSKKSIPNNELENYMMIYGQNDELDKIILKNKSKEFIGPLTIRVFRYNNEKEVILMKDDIYIDKKSKFVLPIFPLIDLPGQYQIIVEVDGKVIKNINYQIIMTNNHDDLGNEPDY
ncbi:MAG: hypothetical protein ACO3DH_09085 [Candidatus Kapaibacteriota bacterium]